MYLNFVMSLQLNYIEKIKGFQILIATNLIFCQKLQKIDTYPTILHNLIPFYKIFVAEIFILFL